MSSLASRSWSKSRSSPNEKQADTASTTPAPGVAVEAGVLPSAQFGVAPVWCFRPHDPAIDPGASQCDHSVIEFTVSELCQNYRTPSATNRRNAIVQE